MNRDKRCNQNASLIALKGVLCIRIKKFHCFLL